MHHIHVNKPTPYILVPLARAVYLLVTLASWGGAAAFAQDSLAFAEPPSGYIVSFPEAAAVSFELLQSMCPGATGELSVCVGGVWARLRVPRQGNVVVPSGPALCFGPKRTAGLDLGLTYDFTNIGGLSATKASPQPLAVATFDDAVVGHLQILRHLTSRCSLITSVSPTLSLASHLTPLPSCTLVWVRQSWWVLVPRLDSQPRASKPL